MTFEEALAAQQRGNDAEAEQGYRSVLECEPTHLIAALNLGAILFGQGRLTEAIERYRTVLSLSPEHVGALNNLGNVLQAAGRIEEAIAVYRQVLTIAGAPLSYRIASNYVSTLQYHVGLSDDTLRKATEAIGQRMGVPRSLPQRRPESIVRLGFVSGDLCDHPVGFFLKPLLRHLDRERFHVVLYANGGRMDETAYRLRSLGEWRDVSDIDNDALIERIEVDAIDILFDLSGHTSRNRLPVFARRAAPIQVSWLGYFATTGISAMDYVLMDPWHVPVGEEGAFSERIIRLPHTRFCYEPVSFAPDMGPLPAKRSGRITFGSFNNTAKLNNRVIATWTDILRRVPQSRLVLKWRTFADPMFRAAIMRQFTEAGIEAARIELRQQSGHLRVLEEYAEIDIALDPFPFSGGQTSCEALWMGVPVITLPGSRPVSRQTLCFLANIGLSECAALDEADYVGKAVALAGDWERLDALHMQMRPRMLSSPLMDAPAFAQDFMHALQSMLGTAADTRLSLSGE